MKGDRADRPQTHTYSQSRSAKDGHGHKKHFPKNICNPSPNQPHWIEHVTVGQLRGWDGTLFTVTVGHVMHSTAQHGQNSHELKPVM